MNKKITVFAALVVSASFVLGILGTRLPRKTVTAENDTYALGDLLSRFSGEGGIGDIIGGSGGSDGDALGGLGDILGGLGDRFTTNRSTTERVTYDIETIVPVVTRQELSTIFEAASESTTEETVSTTHGLRIEEGVDSVPYSKPTGSIEQNEEGDGVRWIQWIFIYTNYGLRADGITGVLDEDTLACVRRLQQEKGLIVDGIVDEEVIDAVELLYFEKQLSGNTGQYIEDSAGVTETVAEQNPSTEKTVKIIAIIISVIVVWALVIVTVIAVLSYKKKKLAKQLESFEEEPEKIKEPEGDGDLAKKDTVGSLADLFEEAENNAKKKKRRKK